MAMGYGILIVDDQRDILRLLHSTLKSLKNADLKIYEAPSGEEGLLEASRNKIDLLVADYKLPGITGVELMHKIRARHPEVKVILITGVSDRKARDEMLKAGAMAIFDKPIPLADFLAAVERGLGLIQTIFPSQESDEKMAARISRLADLLANFRQDIHAEAVFLLNDRGLVQARAGDLHDSSMEVSLLSALMAIHSAGLKVSHYIHQDALDAYFVFSGGDQDLLFVPVNSLYAILVAGDELLKGDKILDTIAALQAVRNQVDRTLRSMGATGELPPEPEIKPVLPVPEPPTQRRESQGRPLELDAILKEAGKKKADEVDTFWDQAAERHGNIPASPEVLTYEQARKLGLTPDKGKQ
jgi:DNA-binding response OmpR family regulator